MSLLIIWYMFSLCKLTKNIFQHQILEQKSVNNNGNMCSIQQIYTTIVGHLCWFCPKYCVQHTAKVTHHTAQYDSLHILRKLKKAW